MASSASGSADHPHVAPGQQRARGGEYPLIDQDPHFGRVVRYMRPGDYALWAGVTVASPLLFNLWERLDHMKSTPKAARAFTRLVTLMGFNAGFMLAYQNSTKRFWGWTENSREYARDLAELRARARAGLPLYGETKLDDFQQDVAARNSTWSQTVLAVIPWFNFANHKYHGVDTSKYYEEDSKVAA